ncbi:MAG: right-handed parallel beta-helix repeat-containing protein [Candidatus Thermoplasmatota archaeon]|nr:right-handed parallel beta-helix repeat-containing protein [Candidatus Thermoplasmatota archaeon]
MKEIKMIALAIATLFLCASMAGVIGSHTRLVTEQTVMVPNQHISESETATDVQPETVDSILDNDMDGVPDTGPLDEINHAVTYKILYTEPPVPFGTTLYVGGSGPGNYTAIQDAIDDAAPGDTVYVYDDSSPYDENLLINKTINLIGENRDTTVVDGGYREGPVAWVQSANFVNISGFTFQHGNSYGIALHTAEHTTIDNCIMHNNSGTWTLPGASYNQIGLIVYHSSHATVTNSMCHHNAFYGAHSFECDYITVDNCDFYANTAIGWYWRVTNYNHISNCRVYDNGGYGISAYYFDYNIIEDTYLDNNANQGLPISESHYNEFTNLTITNNAGGMTLAGGLFINYYSGNNTITGCHIYDNNKYGVAIRLSPDNTWDDNVLYNNAEGPFGFSGESLAEFYQDLDTSNTEAGEPIYYYVEQNDQTITGEPAGFIGLVSCVNVTVSDMTLSGIVLADTTDCSFTNVDCSNGAGIFIWESTDNSFEDCSVDSSKYGLLFTTAPDNTFTNTVLTNNVFNILVNGEYASDFVEDIDTTNTINGKPIYYLVGQSGITVPSTAGFVGLISCSDMTVDAVDAYGLLLVDTTDSTISNSAFHGSIIGMFLFESTDNTLSNCQSHHNSDGTNGMGLYLYYADDNIFEDCVFSDDDFAVYLEYSSGNEFTDCVAYNSTRTAQWYFATASNNIFTRCECYNGLQWGWAVWYSSNNNHFIECTAHGHVRDGFYLYQSSVLFENCSSYENTGRGAYLYKSTDSIFTHCTFIDNGGGGARVYWDSNGNTFQYCTLEGNGGSGVYIYKTSYNNSLHHNNFIDNAQNAYDENTNFWENATLGEGNYWDDYTGVDADNNGIGDTPYNITGGTNVDTYPLMCPWGTDTTPPEISIVHPTPGVYWKNNKILSLPQRIISIGQLSIQANVTDECGLVLVEFYVDDVLVFSNTTGLGPYAWEWNIFSFFKKHTLTVTGYDRQGNSGSEDITLRVIFLQQ